MPWAEFAHQMRAWWESSRPRGGGLAPEDVPRYCAAVRRLARKAADERERSEETT